MCSTTGEIRSDDLTSARVHGEVRLPQIADVNPETGTVDEQVDRPMACGRTKRDLTKRPEPS
jgi:hypothetical protein